MAERRILLVFAHPDDESFTSGGTIVHYSRQADCQIHLLCATRGDAGKTGDPPQCTKEDLSHVREAELRKAAEYLGIHSVTFLDYLDGKLKEVPTETLAEDITGYLDLFHPQVVITFPPHGISGHPDHQAIQQATFLAVSHHHDETKRKLFYPIIPQSKAPQNRQIFTDPDDAVDVAINVQNYLEPVAMALLAHKTQNMSLNRVFPELAPGNYSSLRKNNYFHLAWTNLNDEKARTSEPYDDLFISL